MIEDIPVFLLHGLGATPITLWPLEKYLNKVTGFKNTHKIYHPSIDTSSFDESLDHVDKEIQKHANKDQEIMLIGQSMGGVIANSLHKRGWNIKYAVYIGSPLHGARLITKLESTLPTKVITVLYKKPYDFLKNKNKEEEPLHNYHTISMGWFCTTFDGCVYSDETMLDESKHTHLSWADHRTIFVNPRLWSLVGKSFLDSFSY